MPANADPAQQVRVRHSCYTWQPSAEIEARLPQDFRLSLEAYTARDGVRRFFCERLGSFLLEASLGGHAILAARKHFDRQENHRFHLARLVYQQGPCLRESLGRHFRREEDLQISPAGRISAGDKYVLPAGLNTTPRKLIAVGRKSASERGIASPSTADCIRLGLFEAASRNPLDPAQLIKGAKRQLVAATRRLVRLALFDLGPAPESMTKTLIKRVTDRLSQALEPHLWDDTDAFKRWFFGGVNDLVHQIAKKRRPGGPIERSQVRQALVEIVFQAHLEVAACVDAQMTAFRDAIVPPLKPRERLLFDSVFLGQRDLGGFSLALLRDRFDFLRESIQDLWGRPGDRHEMGVLWRLLQYYGEMASKRREADREYKKQRHHKNKQRHSAQILALDTERTQAPASDFDRFQEIVAAIRAKSGVICQCKNHNRWTARLVNSQPTDRDIRILDGCEGCGRSEEFTISRTAFAKFARELNS